MKRKPLTNTIKYSTRVTQSILQYGVGAMVDFPDQTLMTAAPEHWAGSIEHIRDPRLENALGVDYFGMPKEDKIHGGIGYVRFPEWYFCPICRRLKPINEWVEEYRKYGATSNVTKDPDMTTKLCCYKCSKTKPSLVASNIITICKNGHIGDFPWADWAHAKSIPPREKCCDNPPLELRTGASLAEGLQGIIVKCTKCGASATLKDAFYPDVFKELVEKGWSGFACQGRHPWKPSKNSNCTELPVTKQRGDTSVYYSNTVSSIVIPLFSDRIMNSISESNSFKKYKGFLEEFDEDEKKDFFDKKIEKWNETIATEIGQKPDDIKRIVSKLLVGNVDGQEETRKIDSIEYRYEEFRALSGLDGEIEGSDDFLREEMDSAEYNIPGIKKIVLIKKLREVCALIGFSRCTPVNNDENEEGFVSIKRKDTNWYPGYQVRGEGIFIEFNMDELDKWASSQFVQHRNKLMLNNYKSSDMAQRMGLDPIPQKVLIHTLAHLLIKQLSYECGYNVASLKERIYYNNSGDEKMAAILLYTASGDSEGTLGGLVRQGKPDSLPRIFFQAVEKAQMCSSDPICITSEGQGREALNLAACHACSLLPETSCELFNIMLDRGLVVGTFENPFGGFYSSLIRDMNELKSYEGDSKESIAIDNKHSEDKNNSKVTIEDEGASIGGNISELLDYIQDDITGSRDEIFWDSLRKKYAGAKIECPIYMGAIVVDKDSVNVDLIWPNSKVMFFYEENYEDYNFIKDKTDWTIICNYNSTNNVDEFVQLIGD
ncbi:DUF1998 domain-containing protein [Butyrivibrio fibrisolvens]|uniref:DUF1998 domain-containing protein n=1 Tax=Pseudobutyrivibrio ruminis TaxID=46206 RepID=UPI00040AD5A0|nr:DUF1998 domain-containing protein [Pseudobutyrivibrio ruminis]MDC7278058.1 DUF1998 domain-containing protein [Butyrivibrio fibrisolvens]